MRVFLNPPPSLSLAMQRVAHHLSETAPAFGFEVVNKETQADFFVLHVIGADAEETIQSLRGKPFAMMQYCLRSTQQPDSKWWMPLWDAAAAVWSYYDLIALLKEDKAPIDTMRNFYHAPLGGDFRTFRPWSVPKSSLILTSGYVAESECVHEAAEAVRRLDGKMIHLGPKENFPELAAFPVAFMHRVNDGILSQALSRSKFVAGLRRGEGFELPAVEGLLSGARPVCFDRPHYRQWFEGFAEFIPEGTKEEVTDALEALFRAPYREVTQLEIANARERFDWETLTAGFWTKVREALPAPTPVSVPKAPEAVSPVTPVTPVTTKKLRKLLWSGDAVVASGFARATHKTLDVLRREFDVEVVGINYLGEPHEYPYRVHPALSREAPMDGFGVRKVAQLTKSLRPDVVVLQNDPWNIPMYLKRLSQTPVIASMPVDGKNCKGAALNGLAHAIFWTEFGKAEAQRGGYNGHASVVPLGVDLNIYRPQFEDKMSIRRRNLPADVAEGFIVGNANRNQPRKRWDLTVRYFAEWIHRYKVSDAYLYLHVAPTGDSGYAIEQLATYYGIANRLILAEPEIGMGVSEDSLARTYAMWDVQMSTTQGEGWGLTTLEGMACGIPQIVPDWSALGEWARGSAVLVPCTTTAATPNNINVIGGVADQEIFISSLERLYRDRALRESYSALGLACARQEKFDWTNIGEKFLAVVETALRRPVLEGVGA